MPTDNVVPIDAEVARAIARRAVAFRWFVAVLAAVWLGTLILVLLFTPLPPLVPILVLGTLLVLAEHRFVLFGDETSMSGSIIVAVASVFVFADSSPLAGPMLVASLGGLYLPHVRQRDASKFVTNSGAMSLAAVGASFASGLYASSTAAGVTAVTASIVLATVSYWVINNAVVAIYVTVRGGPSVGSSFRILVFSDASVLVWSSIASAIVVIADERPFIQLVSVVTCVGTNALTSRRRYAEALSERWNRNSFVCELGCWAIATTVLWTSGASQNQLGVLLGAGLGYVLWVRAHTSPIKTAGTAAAALLVTGSLHPPVQVIAAILGIAFLGTVSLSPSSLRSACVLTGILVVDAAILGIPGGPALVVVVPMACVICAAALPHLLAMVHNQLRTNGVSLATLVGMCVPSRWEAAVALGGSVVLAAFSIDVRIGLVATATWLVPIARVNVQRSVTHRRTAIGASH